MGLGYESASGFADAFGKRFGATPGRAKEIVEVRVRSQESPLDPLLVGVSPDGICLLEFADRRALPTELKRPQKHFGAPAIPGTSPHLDQLETKLGEYYSGSRRNFTVPLDLVGTAFQKQIRKE
jgi:AraC family transcriptional regulator of adaptative response/methylated-DNA-[protein]-cysteine methyltransferase